MPQLNDNLIHVLNSLSPVFGIILVGMLLRKGGFVDDVFIRKLSKLVFWVPMPCLLFIKIAKANYNGASYGKGLMILVIGMTSAAIAGYIFSRFFRVGKHRTGTVVQAAFRGNLVYVGLAVYMFSYGGETADLAMLTIAPLIIVYNALAVFVLLGGKHFGDSDAYRRIFTGVLTNPLIIGCVAGLIFQFSGFSVPQAVDRGMTTLGGLALPGALLCLGGSLVTIEIKGEFLHASMAALIKTALCPLVGLLCCKLMNIGLTETRIVLVFLAAPTAVASHVVAEQLGGDSHLAAACVAMSTFFSIFSLSAVVAFA